MDVSCRCSTRPPARPSGTRPPSYINIVRLMYTAVMKRLQIMIDEDLDDALAKLAAEEGQSKAALIRRFRERLHPLPPLSADPLSRLSGAASRARAGGRRRLPMIFVDTSFWVAQVNTRDQHHALARALLREHGDTGLVTSNHVRGETWTFLRRRAGHRHAVAFLDAVERSPRVQVAIVSEELEAGPSLASPARRARVLLRGRDQLRPGQGAPDPRGPRLRRRLRRRRLHRVEQPAEPWRQPTRSTRISMGARGRRVTAASTSAGRDGSRLRR